MWIYLKKVYHKENLARQCQLEFKISQHAQGNSSIQDYYSSFLALWTEYDEIKYADVSDEVLSRIQEIQANTHKDQFLMKLWPEFESVRSNLMSRVPAPSLDDCLNELLRDEQTQLTQGVLVRQVSGSPLLLVYDVRIQSQTSSTSLDVAFAAKGTPPGKDMSKVQSFRCQNFGHYANQCKHKVCTYCKENRTCYQ